MANLKELAETLGLSQTTVSRALNGYPEVSEATRRRVKAAAAQADYAPNPSARGLATGKARTIGHVVPLSMHDMINPHFTDFIAAAGKIYSAHGYDMLIRVVDKAEEADAYRKLKRDRRVDGVIVHGPLADEPRISLLQDLQLPFVVHGRANGPSDGYAWVDVNNRRSFLRATRHLIELGHRDIALINGFEQMVFAARRRAGFEAALQEADLTPQQHWMASDDMTEHFGYSTMGRMLDSATPPTAVVCASMLPAIGALRAIRERGLEPGHDVSLIAHDDCLSFLSRGWEGFSLTVMQSAIREAGEICARMLIDQIEGRETAANVLLEASFVKGGSTGAPAHRSRTALTRRQAAATSASELGSG